MATTLAHSYTYATKQLQKKTISTKPSNDVTVLTITNYDQGYETLGFWRKLVEPLRIAFILFIACFGFIGKFLLIRYSKTSRDIKRFRTKYRALELLYTYKWGKTKGRNIIDRVLTHMNQRFLVSNCRAVRNRLRLVKTLLRFAIFDIRKTRKEITIASLGAGSARAIIETIAELQNRGFDCQFTVILVDVSKNALHYSERLAKEYGIADSVNWIRRCGLLEEFVNNTHEHSPDIVEMVGIMDYFDKITSLDVISQIYDILTPFGVLITANIQNNPEKIFLDRVLEWPMVHRGPEELAEIMLSAGFEAEDIEIIYEPLQIHGVVVARKVTRLIRKAY